MAWYMLLDVSKLLFGVREVFLIWGIWLNNDCHLELLIDRRVIREE